MTLSTEFSSLADRASVSFPERMDIQHAACALLGSWALNHRAEIAAALQADGALRTILAQYGNQDMSHEDFRVMTAHVITETLGCGLDGKPIKSTSPQEMNDAPLW
jgi:hypothetical protein